MLPEEGSPLDGFVVQINQLLKEASRAKQEEDWVSFGYAMWKAGRVGEKHELLKSRMMYHVSRSSTIERKVDLEDFLADQVTRRTPNTICPSYSFVNKKYAKGASND